MEGVEVGLVFIEQPDGGTKVSFRARSRVDVSKLAERFGHKFTRTEDGYQIHGVVTHLIDREGRWQANFHGLEFEPTNLVVYIKALTHEHGQEQHAAPSLWEQIRGRF